MHEQVAGKLDPGRHEQSRPEHGVKLEYVLADEVKVGGPEAVEQVLPLVREAQRGQVVEQRVEPHIEHLLGVPRHGYAPAHASAGERDVLKPGGDERASLVETVLGKHEVASLLVQALERFLKRGQRKEPVVLV